MNLGVDVLLCLDKRHHWAFDTPDYLADVVYFRPCLCLYGSTERIAHPETPLKQVDCLLNQQNRSLE